MSPDTTKRWMLFLSGVNAMGAVTNIFIAIVANRPHVYVNAAISAVIALVCYAFSRD